MIAAAPASQVLLPIEVGPPEALPNNCFVRVRGLPPTVSLSDGHAIGPGSWAIPLFALPTLKANIPAGIAERGNVVISLVGVDGTLIAEARTVLVIGICRRRSCSRRPAQNDGCSRQRSRPPAPAGHSGRPARDAHRRETGRARNAFWPAARSTWPAATSSPPATSSSARRTPVWQQRPFGLRRPMILSSFAAHRRKALLPDAAMARQWYERARELGAPEAVERLARLGGN